MTASAAAAVAGAAALMLAVAAAGHAQPAGCAACVSRSDSAFFHADARGSLAQALAGLKRDSNDVALLCRAARAEIALAILSAEDRSVIDARYARAIAWARRAVTLAPRNAEPHYWLAAASGRLAMRKDFRTAASLASESYRGAQRALAIDSLHAGAHDIVGKLNGEVRKLPWIVRKLAATFTGLEMARTASWEDAERHLIRAVHLDPTLLVARSDLSQLYLRMGNRAAAVAAVEALEAQPRRTPVDAFIQDEARKRLARYP